MPCKRLTIAEYNMLPPGTTGWNDPTLCQCRQCPECQLPTDMQQVDTGNIGSISTGITRKILQNNAYSSSSPPPGCTWKSGYPQALAGYNWTWWISRVVCSCNQGSYAGARTTGSYNYIKNSLLICENGSAVNIINDAVEAGTASHYNPWTNQYVQCPQYTNAYYEYSRRDTFQGSTTTETVIECGQNYGLFSSISVPQPQEEYKQPPTLFDCT